jgi:hypothetical protein
MGCRLSYENFGNIINLEILHSKIMIEQHELHKISRVNLGAPEG